MKSLNLKNERLSAQQFGWIVLLAKEQSFEVLL